MDAHELRTLYREWKDEELVGLLHQAGDRLPGEAVTEIAVRNETTKWMLKSILEDRQEWARAGITSWAAVHALLLFLDAPEPDETWDTRDRWPTLMAAVKFALAYDLDEGALADLPLVVASQGTWVSERLAGLARDPKRRTREKRIWVTALAAAAKCDNAELTERLDVLRAIAADASEKLPVRALAARRLMDWLRAGDRETIAEVARLEEAAGGIGELLPEEVAEAYERDVPELSPYIRNWQAFYYRETKPRSEPPELPLPSWRVEEKLAALRACEPFFADPRHSVPGLRGVAEFALETLVMKRFAAVRLWRTVDVAAVVERAARDPGQLEGAARSNFAEALARFVEILGAAERIEVGDWRRMAAWVRRRAARIGRLVGPTE